MQQGGGGGSGSQSQYGEMSGGVGGGPATDGVASTHMVDQSQHQLVEAASPISSRPPAAGNLDELIRFSSGGDEDALGAAAAAEEGDRAGASSSNRWPRQETLALLKIRSEMDAAFRDATVKGPLWEDVSRKLAELGYKRSAKKCKEKFENVHKYYKRTKEGRAGRQDGKSYKFFSELEALHSSSAAAAVTHATNVSMSVTPATAGTTTLDVSPVSVGIPMQVPSARIPPNPSQPAVSTVPVSSSIFTMPAPPLAPAPQAPSVYTSAAAQFGISFSSDSSSSSERSEDDDDDDVDEEEVGGEPSTAAGGSRKRKRQSSRVRRGSGNTRRMMQFFEGLMKQVMQKQEAMQQRFLEAIEKREQDRMIREDAWKRQEMVRLAHEHELMAQERAVAASRDTAIVSFLQRITGQTIQLPTTITIPTVTLTPPPMQPAQVITPAAPISTAAAPQHQPPVIQQQTPLPPSQVQQVQLHHQHQHQQPQRRSQSSDGVRHQAPISSEVVMAIPEQTVPPQDIGGSGSSEPTSSRWPKPEVLALIKLRSGLESRYQEAGPKGPLWEEISGGMLQMGYKRSAKRCKEKWENINKYFKKVKEGSKKRTDDAKTCPYFHELDALYKKKIIGGSGGGASSSSFTGQQRSEEQTSEQHQQESSVQVAPATAAATQPTQAGESENKSGAGGDVQAGKEGFTGSLLGEGNGATKEPEDIMRELMEQQGIPQQQHQHQQPGQPLAVEDYEKLGDPDSDVMDEDEDDNEEDEDESEEDRKMAYKIEFQRQNTGPSNGGGNGTPSFLTMVQ